MKSSPDKISRKLSLILRHHPEHYDLMLDSEGWTDINVLLNALNDDLNINIDLSKLERTLNSFQKQRFEIKNEKIRAKYGHSIEQEIKISQKIPPELLYHGTNPRLLKAY